jgi:hypothetical protein
MSLFAFILGILPEGNSQEILTGLKQNAQLIKAYKTNILKSDRFMKAVQLPFIEDFSTYIGYPEPSLFKDNQVVCKCFFSLFSLLQWVLSP